MAKREVPRHLLLSGTGTAFLRTQDESRLLQELSQDVYHYCAWKSDDEGDDASASVWQLTRQGRVKRTSRHEYKRATRKLGIRSIDLEDGDRIAAAFVSDHEGDILVASRGGKVTRFSANDLICRPRAVRGITAMWFDQFSDGIESEDAVCDACFLPSRADCPEFVGCLTANGFAVRFPVADVRCTVRGTSGVLATKVTTQTGPMVVAELAAPGTSVHLVLSDGSQTTVPWDDVPVRRRNATAVPVILSLTAQIVRRDASVGSK